MRQIAVGVNSAPALPVETKLLPAGSLREGYCPFSRAVPFPQSEAYMIGINSLLN
jgi:hypothetical protein